MGHIVCSGAYFFIVLCPEFWIAFAKCLSWFSSRRQVNTYIIHHYMYMILNGRFLFPRRRLAWIPSQGYIVLVFRGKYSVLVFLMFENVQTIQLHVSRGPEPLTKAFLPGVIDFGLEMRFFFLRKKCLCICIKELDFLYEVFLNAQRTSLKAPFTKKSSNL